MDLKDTFRFVAPKVRDTAINTAAQLNRLGIRNALAGGLAVGAQAERLYAIAQTGLRGVVAIPTSEKDCQRMLDSLKLRLDKGQDRLEEVAEARAGTAKLREPMLDVLRRWFIQGKTEL